MSFATPSWDLELFRLANDTLRLSFLDYAMPVASYTPLIWFLAVIAIGGVLYCGYHNWRRLLLTLMLVGITVGLTDMTCNLIKHESGRLRPYQALADVHYMSDGVWKQNPPSFQPTATKGSSFVSSHAANTMALSVMLMLLIPWTRPWLGFLPILVGWSRLYLGKHYPLDVLCGYLVGALIALAIWDVYKAYRKR